MKKYVVLMLVMCYLFACTESDVNPEAPESAQKVETLTLSPVLHLTFDHDPTDEEIRQAYDKASLESINGINPVSSPSTPDANYEKMVTLKVKTADYNNAGTDHAGHCKFIGKWYTSSGLYSNVEFLLDNTSEDDLDRNQLDIFYYTYTVSQSYDQLITGKLSNTASDGWLCQYVEIKDQSCSSSRTVQFNWGDPGTDFVQSDGNVFSSEENSSSSAYIYYTNCM
jgi:hypothetical protein